MPLCVKHGQVFGEGCKCPLCNHPVIHVPVPEGDHNPEVTFLEGQDDNMKSSFLEGEKELNQPE